MNSRELACSDKNPGTVDLIGRARALAPMIAGAAAQIEASRELTPEVVSALHDAGLFRMLMPRAVGGHELAPAVYTGAIEEIAKADASTAWCVAQTSVSSTLCASLGHQVAWEMFGADKRALLAMGPPGTAGRAVGAPGGLRITGT
jgi:alkylation response protein AidB-like acyl-CoA dehydrogenase